MRAPLCAAALLLYIGAEAQWPQRLDFAGLNDEASATAVDRWGNVYVAGTITTTTEKKDFYVASYTASGVMRLNWPRRYTGPGGGDDIATSIHVDPSSGNVYVGGTSYGGTTSGFDFCVIAYNSGGQVLWPGSGSAGTGYVYHNGALRSTQSSGEAVNEGAGSVQGSPGTATDVHVSMAVREDLLAENRLIAMTGIIARVNNPAGHYWRTVVFQPGASNNPVLRDGWPVNLDTVTTGDEIPRQVAIYTDNSVYVTGKTTPLNQSQHRETFTTVRYKPSGGDPAQAAFWRHDWAPNENSKLNSGVDIALDRNGDAYATGYLNLDSVDYGTVAIRKDADVAGNPQLKWQDIWDNALEDEANSISLTYEVENGAVVPYAFVTGKSANYPLSDIATLRYRGDSLQRVWATVHTPGTGDEEVLDVVGAGYGNAYVVGRIDNKLAVIGYRRDGTIRVGPTLYDNNGFGGLHEGRMGVMVGAGALADTGVSQGTALADFVTQTVSQATTAGSPSSYILRVGSYLSGSVANLVSSDDQYLVFKDNPASDDVDVVRVEFTGTTAVTNPTEICLYHEGRTSVPLRQRIEVWDWLAGQYVQVDLRSSTTGDSRLVVALKDDPSRFLSGGVFKVRLGYVNVDSDEAEYFVYFDQLTWEVLGG